MAQLTLYRQDATQSGTAELRDEVFKAPLRPGLLHAAVRRYLANQRQGTHKTKTRGEVSGGGKKPWKQKHTGRARQGSIRAPQWKGGGTVWGPQPRDYRMEMNRKERALALKSALSAKVQDGGLVILENLELAAPKTKEIVAFLKKFQAENRRVLLVASRFSETMRKAARNIRTLCMVTDESLHPYDLLRAEKVFLTMDAARGLEERLA